MSAWRDEQSHRLVTAAGHPDRAYAMLGALIDTFISKINDLKDEEDEFNTQSGLREGYALLMNMRNDIARDYGIDREGK